MVLKKTRRYDLQIKKYDTKWYPRKNSIKKEKTKNINTTWKESTKNTCLVKRKATNRIP